MKSEITKERAPASEGSRYTAATGELEKRKRGTPQSGVPLPDGL
jgi:hypothetical protein